MICILLYQNKDLEQIKEEQLKLFSIYVTSLWITNWTFTLEKIKLNLSFSISKAEKRMLEH